MARRILAKASGAPAGQFSADDIDYINQLLTGVSDQSATDPVLIDTSFGFNSSKLRFKSTGTGTPYYTVVNPSGTTARTITIPNLAQNDTLAVLTEPQTMAGKTLTTPTIASILSGSGTFVHNTTGTITVPNGTQTLATLAGTEALSGKTITSSTVNAASNTMQGFIQDPSVKVAGSWLPVAGSGAASGFGLLGGATIATVPTGQGTVTNTNGGTDGKYSTFPSGTTIDQEGGIRWGSGTSVTRTKNCRFKAKFRVPTITSTRLFVGFSNAGAAYLTGNDPLNALAGVILGYRDTDTNFQIGHHSGNAGATVFENASPTTAIDTGIHTIEIKAIEASTKFQYSFDGGTFTDLATSASEIPSSTSTQMPHAYVQTTTTASRSLDLWYVYVEADQ